jgi:hypothetical protein
MGAYDSLHDFLHNVEAMFAGFVHNMTGLPVSSHFPNVDLTVRDRVLAVAAVLSFAIVFWLVLRASTRQSRPELLAPTLALAAALALAFADVLPFGDGRTDEVLYPCVAVLIAAGLDWLWRASSKIRWMRVGTAVVAGTVLALALNTTVTKDARYPEAGISALIAKIRPYVKPGDVIVVPTYLSFSWAEAGLSPWRVDLNPVQGWPQGFRVASTTTSVILPVVWTGPDPQLRDLSDHYQRVWYIGYELAVWNPYAPTKKFPGTLPMYTYTRQQLKFRGWRVAWFPTRGYHCYAELMTHTAAATK